MSVEVSSWAWKVEGISPAEKLVLLCLSDHSDDEGVSWPSQSRISKKTGLTRQSVNKAIAKFKGLGLLETEPLTKVEPFNRFLRYKLRSDTPVTSGYNGLSPQVTTIVASGDTESSENHHIESSLKKPQAVLVLPDWINNDTWDAFKEMRKKERHPLTDRACLLVVRELEKLRAGGHDPNECLERSVLNGWRGVFAPNGNGKSRLEIEQEARRKQTEEILTHGLDDDAKRDIQSRLRSTNKSLSIFRTKGRP